MLRKIDATVIFVQDLGKCLPFYRDTLGFPVTFTDDVSVAFKLQDHDFVLLKFAAAEEMISEEAIAFHKAGGQRVLLCAGVEDVHITYNELRAKGVTFIKPPVDQAWGRCTAYFADPEGNLWEIWHSLPPEQTPQD